MKNPNELVIPALRAHMGDWIYYVTFLRMDQIADQIRLAGDIHPSTALKDMIQREITNRASQISDYLLKQEQRFFNSLIVGVYGGSPDWYELKIGANRHFDAPDLPPELEGILGILRLDGTQIFFALDGQHRVEGIKQAVKKNDDLKKEEVSVIFVAHRNDPMGMERTRRLFTTLNRYAKPVQKTEIIALDEDDTIAIITRDLVEKYPLFCEKCLFSTEVESHIHLSKNQFRELIEEKFSENRIDLSRNVRISVKTQNLVWSITDYTHKQTYAIRRENDKLNAYYQKISIAKTKAISPLDGNNITSIITLYDVLDTMLGKKKKSWHDFKKLRPDPSLISQYRNRAIQFWDMMIEHFPSLKDFKETHPGISVAGRYRHASGGHLLFRPVGLEIIASVIKEATDSGLTENEAIKRVSNIPMELANKPWAGLLWDKANQRMLTVPTNKKVAKQLLFHSIGGNLSRMKTNIDDVQEEYAGLLNREKSEVKLPQYHDSFS